MKLLLINPNRYHHPPVIPLSLEYIAGELLNSNHDCQVLDLCFSGHPEKDIEKSVSSYKPDLVGFTIRQIDTVLYQNNEFFMDEITGYIKLCKNLELTVVLGGAGFSIMPLQTLHYTGADYGITGPGEKAIIKLLDNIEKNNDSPAILNGYDYFTNNFYRFTREIITDYQKYITHGGIVGFRTQIGCNSHCIFCTEANKKIIFHLPQSVGKEIARLKNLGFDHFHLCDSEFNLYLKHSIAVCQSIVEEAGPVNWALYMKPSPFSEELFYWIKQSGANLITLSMNTRDFNNSYKSRINDFIHLANRQEIKIAIDLSTGFPYEKIEKLEKTIDFLTDQPVETVGVNAFYRVYPGTGLYNIVMNDNLLHSKLINYNDENNFIHPVFFNHFTEELVRDIINGKTKFRVEGFEKETNYQRVKG